MERNEATGISRLPMRELCEVADIDRTMRRDTAHGAKADLPKRRELFHRLQDLDANRRTFAAPAANEHPLSLALAMLGAHAGPAR
jgi:hypothetical protein